jgi:hypothetical protein
MAINIKNLIDVIDAKIAAGVTAGTTDSDRLTDLTTWVNTHKNAGVYNTLADLPTADSANAGVFAQTGADSSAAYYVSWRNKWKEITFTDSSISQTPVSGYSYQGSTTAYTAGGVVGPSSVQTNSITSFPFASSSGGSDYGDLTQSKSYLAGVFSSTNGYTMGGSVPPASPTNVIEKFPLATPTGSGTDVGDLTTATDGSIGITSNSYGYSAGGNGFTGTTTVEKLTFASEGNSTDVLDLAEGTSFAASNANSTDGYVVSGFPSLGVGSGYSELIQKFPFASDTNATDIGDVAVKVWDAGGTSSTEVAYQYGGAIQPPGNESKTFQKFPFATGTSINPGSFTGSPTTSSSIHSNSGTDASYISAQSTNNPPNIQMWKIPFASETTASEWTGFSVPLLGPVRAYSRATSNIQV